MTIQEMFADLEAKGHYEYDYIKSELSQITADDVTSEEVEAPPFLYLYLQLLVDCVDANNVKVKKNYIHSDRELSDIDKEDIQFSLTDINYDTVKYQWYKF